MAGQSHPIEGQIVLLAGAQASVPLQNLSGLLRRVQRHLTTVREDYERRFERVEGQAADYCLLDDEQWDRLATEVGLTDSERDAVERAHEAQFRRDGRRLGRSDDFESMLDIRQPLVVGPSRDSGAD